jgi:hypothetical protein
MAELNLDRLQGLQTELDAHPVYAAVKDLADLRIFMAHHIFSVWDFMSLIKYLQRHIAPVQVPWMPHGDPALRFFVNQLVLEEESDNAPGPNGADYGSHFEYYLAAMREIGADTEPALRFLDLVRDQGVDKALYSDIVPMPSRYFCETTFNTIREDKPHAVAAALALGRERIIPTMFRRLVEHMGLGPDQAPTFHRYLERHIQMDGDFHGPLSFELLATLCSGDGDRITEAETAAEEAICARIRFWDGVLDAIRVSHAG